MTQSLARSGDIEDGISNPFCSFFLLLGFKLTNPGILFLLDQIQVKAAFRLL
jgi:hypothetical protein